MATDNARVSVLSDARPNNDGKYVLYWMEHSQRAENNDAFEHSIGWANTLKLPVLVLFTVDPDYPDGNARHFTFMLQGLRETIETVKNRGAHFSLRKGKPAKAAAEMARDAAVVITDRGYLRHLNEWRREVADACKCRFEMIECDVVVPVEVASNKRESAARTIRPKLHRTIGDFLELPASRNIKHKAKGLGSPDDLDLNDVAQFVEGLQCDASVGPVKGFTGGLAAARQTLKTFTTRHLRHYGDGRADITTRNVSHLSPYLHLGMISPLEVYDAVKTAGGNSESVDVFVEEFVIRRELAVNYCHYNQQYDSWDSIPAWAKETLKGHESDERSAIYTLEQLEQSKTDDPYWNAAMREMRITGYLHNHMRMYWGKRIITYTTTAQDAFEKTIYLNNKYFLDGRDANSYASISWLYGIHDRGWPRQPIFGKVRTMAPSGLKRKFDIDAYVKWTRSL